MNANMKRGIRTLAEVAHFVRCIPYMKKEDPNVWISPDIMLTIRAGQIQDHALLMASMFRAVKFETHAEVMAEFQRRQR